MGQIVHLLLFATALLGVAPDSSKVVEADADHVTTYCRSSTCHESQCNKTRCEHGQCSTEGLCLCSPCWTGKHCDNYKNEHYPGFDRLSYVGNATGNVKPGSTLVTIHATDPDTQLTCHHGGGGTGGREEGQCDCGRILYAIVSGNDGNLFGINENTGEISMMKKKPVDVTGNAVLYVSAVNAEVKGLGGSVVGPKNFATVTMVMGGERGEPRLGGAMDNMIFSDGRGPEEDSMDAPHERHRRSITQVSNMTFYLIKTGIYNATTTMYVGSKVHFQLQIQFPLGTNDLLVELFTPDNASTVMVICNPQITWIGQYLSFNQTAAAPVLDALNYEYMVNNYDHATFNFGNVTNTGAGATSVNDVMIFIEWDAIMVVDSNTVSNNVYWVSAGAAFDQQNEIWVGQTGFTCIVDDYNVSEVGRPLTFNLTGPSTIEVGTSVVFEVDMYIPYPVSDIVVEGFTPLNNTDVMTACSAVVIGVGSNYECIYWSNLTGTTYPSATGLTNDRVMITVGNVVNSGSRETTPSTADLIAVQFVIHMPYNSSLVGMTMWIGASVEIGTTQIWAGQMSVYIANTTFSGITAAQAPTYTLAGYNASTLASTTTPTVIEYNITTYNNTDTTYVVTVTSLANQYKICGIRIAFQGINVPCAGDFLPVYQMGTGSSVINEVIWDLGRVRNTGQKSPSVLAGANTIQMYITVQALNVTANSVGSTAPLVASTAVGTLAPSSNTLTLTMAGPESIMATSTASSLSSQLSLEYGTTQLYVNASTDVRLTITTSRGYVYAPFTVQFIMPPTPDNSSYLFGICRASVLSVGGNMPCVNQTQANSSMVYADVMNATSSQFNYMSDVNFGAVCNAGPTPSGGYNATAADKIELSVIVTAMNQPTAVNGTLGYVTALVSFGNAVTWVGNVNFTVYNPYQVTYTNGTPFIAIPSQQINQTTNVSANGVATFTVMLKVPPQSVADWEIVASIGTDPDLSVCAVYVVQTGYAIPCWNTTIPTRTISRVGGQPGYTTAWLDMYKLSNVGSNVLYPNNIFDNNSVIIQVVVQAGPNAVPGSSHGVFVTADYGMNGVDASNNLSITIAPPFPTAVVAGAAMPNFTFTQSPVNVNATVSNIVYPGQPIIMTAVLTIPTNALMSIQVSFVTSTPGLIDMSLADVVWVGVNIPCLSKMMFTSNITSLTGAYGDLVSFNLGSVCQFPIDTTQTNNSQIMLEVIGTVIRNVTWGTVTVTSTMTVNGTAQPPVAMTFTYTPVVPTIEFPNNNTVGMAAIQLNVTNTTIIPLGPSDMYTLFADITVPPNETVFGLVDCQTPFFQSDVLTILQIHIVSFGRNLGSVQYTDYFATVFNSTLNTSQMDKGYISMSLLTNTGHTYRSGRYQVGDDSFRIFIQLQMADAAVAAAGNIYAVSVGAKIGVPIMFANLTVSVVRAATDAPVLILEPWLNSIPTYTVGNSLTFSCMLFHSNLSRSEVHNVSVFIDLSKDVIALANLWTNYTSPIAANLTNVTGSSSIFVYFDHVYFTDYINFTFTLVVVSASGGSGLAELTILPVQPVYNIYWPAVSFGLTLAMPMTNVNFTIMIPSTAFTCPGTALGMQSGAIKNCQITGSVSPVVGNTPAVNARLTNTGWITLSRYGSFSRYVQVNLVNLTQITGVTLKSPAGTYVSTFLLQYSNDGINWVNSSTYSTSTFAYYTSGALSTIPVGAVINSIFVRFEILTTTADPYGEVTLTIEFLGCSIAAPSVPISGCLAQQGWQPISSPLANFSPRDFITAGGVLYFCDTSPDRAAMYCFSSANGLQWSALPNSVINVIGYLPSASQLYGIDWGLLALVMSENGGATWSSVSTGQYTWATAQAGYHPGKPVPWQQSATLLVGTAGSNAPAAVFQDTPWGASFDGMYIIAGTKRISDWMQCCA